MKITRTITRFAPVLLAAILMAGPVAAQEISPEQLDLARKYVDLTDRSQIYEVSVVQTGIDTMRSLLPQNPELAEELDTAISETIQAYRPRKDELMDQFARIYASRFTVEELQQIVDFYESDVGQKLSRENFEANQQLSTVVNIFQQNLRVEFLAKVRATMKERGFDI